MVGRKSVILSVSVIAVLVSSTMFVVAVSTVPRASAQAPVQGADWLMPNANYQATGFSPQTQITKDNANLLEIKWIFPYPPASPITGLGAAEGSLTNPLIIGGLVYVQKQDLTLIALDARNGKVIWTYKPPATEVNATAAARQLPISTGSPHSHQFTYFNGRLYIPYPNCQIFGINALTGKKEWELKVPYCANLEGNKGTYKPIQSVGPVYDGKRKILIYGAVGGDSLNGGRGAFRGYNLETGDLLWTFYLMPAQCTSDPEWTLRVADKGWIQGIKASSLPREVLMNDWHYQGLVTCKGGLSTGGVGIGWGQWAVDEETGLAYLATAQPGPDWNATYRPGPNVFGDSVIALKTDTGQLVWWHQITAHDLWDVDCSWNTALTTVGGRKMVFKECKGGQLYAMDAATGEAVWHTDYSPYAKRGAIGPQPNWEEPLDPRSVADMTRPWLSYPGNPPNWRRQAGGAESDVTIAYGKVYSTTFNNWAYQRFTSVEPTMRTASGRESLPIPINYPINATIYAHDAATGRLVWKFDIESVGIRGGVSVSGGLVWVPGNNGILYVLDAETGKSVVEKFFGVQVPVQPTMGADSNGKIKVFVNTGAGGIVGLSPTVPGALLAYGLPDKLPEPQVIIKEVVKEVPKEVVKEIVKEVPKEVIKEVIKEVPKEVVRTETKTVTVETISPVSYAAIGIGVVLVVVAGVIFSRRKKA